MNCKGTVLGLRSLLITLLIAVLVVASAGAESVLSSMDQLPGTAMPSIEAALGRTVNDTADTERGKVETYHDFTYEDYNVFVAYLNGIGAKAEDTTIKDGTITFMLSIRGASMEFAFDWNNQTATVVYPSGTRPETEKEVINHPPVDEIGKPMPSLGEALGRYPDEEISVADGDSIEVFKGLTGEDYVTFLEYLGKWGIAPAYDQTGDSSFSVSIQEDEKTIVCAFDMQTMEVRATYPKGTYDKWLSYAKTQFQSAVQMVEAGKTAEGYSALITIPEYSCYKPAAEYLEAHPELASAAAEEELLQSYKTVGNIVTFGTYPQTSSGTDSTAIEWIVLEVQGNQALLLSRYGLDAKPYNTEFKAVTWEESTLRTWLNNTFFNKAFSAKEQRAILTTSVDNSKSQGYSEWSTDGGNNTHDRLFLLSFAEANKYLGVTYDKNSTASRVAPTAYAIQNGAYTNKSYRTSDGTAAGNWWLRSSGRDQLSTALVFTSGSLRDSRVSTDDVIVRPAFWLNLESVASIENLQMRPRQQKMTRQRRSQKSQRKSRRHLLLKTMKRRNILLVIM